MAVLTYYGRTNLLMAVLTYYGCTYQARIYWDMEHYPMVEKIFRQSAEFCSEHELWKLNVAHVFFLQETTSPHPNPHPDHQP